MQHFLDYTYSFLLKVFRLNQTVNVGVQRSVVFFAMVEYCLGEIVVGKSIGTPQSVFDEVLDKAAGEVTFPRGDEIPKLEKPLKL